MFYFCSVRPFCQGTAAASRFGPYPATKRALPSLLVAGVTVGAALFLKRSHGRAAPIKSGAPRRRSLACRQTPSAEKPAPKFLFDIRGRPAVIRYRIAAFIFRCRRRWGLGRGGPGPWVILRKVPSIVDAIRRPHSRAVHVEFVWWLPRLPPQTGCAHRARARRSWVPIQDWLNH